MKKSNKEPGQMIYGVIKVGSKGQVAIPVDLRKALSIEEGSQLVVFRRRDNKGLVMLKIDEFEKMFEPNFLLPRDYPDI